MKKLIIKLWGNSAVRYIFFGGLTTLVNLLSYAALTRLTPLGQSTIGQTAANITSVTLSIIFAFVTNSRFVFHSDASTVKEHLRQFFSFFGARLSTMLIEVGGVYIMSVMGINDMVAKLATQVIVLVLNYVFSKFFVFKSNKR